MGMGVWSCSLKGAERSGLVVGAGQVLGGRAEQQDSFAIHFGERFACFGVFDGHGDSGRAASSFVSSVLPNRIVTTMDKEVDIDCEKSIRMACADVDAALINHPSGCIPELLASAIHQCVPNTTPAASASSTSAKLADEVKILSPAELLRSRMCRSGTTASFCVVPYAADRKMINGLVGDSRCVILRRILAEAASELPSSEASTQSQSEASQSQAQSRPAVSLEHPLEDHSLSRKDETTRIRASGDLIFDGRISSSGLNLSRTFGDGVSKMWTITGDQYKPGVHQPYMLRDMCSQAVISQPDCAYVAVDPDDLILIFSDGLLDDRNVARLPHDGLYAAALKHLQNL